MTSRIFVVGNLVRDPEIRFVGQGGKAVTTITIADNYKRNREAEEEVSYIDVTLWEGLAENFVNSAKKGQRVFAEGRVKQENWEDDNGNKRSKLVIVAEHAGFDLRFDLAQVVKKSSDTRNNSSASQEDPF